MYIGKTLLEKQRKLFNTREHPNLFTRWTRKKQTKYQIIVQFWILYQVQSSCTFGYKEIHIRKNFQWKSLEK